MEICAADTAAPEIFYFSLTFKLHGSIYIVTVERSARFPRGNQSMHRGKNDPHGIHRMLERRVGRDADTAKIAAFAVSIWVEVEAALAPIFEETGVEAIYRRTLDLATEHHPCLVDAHESEQSPGKFAGLAAVLIQQDAEHALVLLASVLNTFHDLITGVFGGTMFERLLRSIWDRPSDSSDPAMAADQDEYAR